MGLIEVRNANKTHPEMVWLGWKNGIVLSWMILASDQQPQQQQQKNEQANEQNKRNKLPAFF